MNNSHTDTKRTIRIICGIMLWCATAARAADLPPDPDNAALLYFQAFLLRPETTLAQMIARDDVLRGAEPNQTVRAGLSRYEEAIDLAVAASERPSCRWGVPYSQGYGARLPQTPQIRDLTLWMGASARTIAADGDHRTAFQRCLTLRRFAGHVGDDTMLLYVVSLPVDAIALTAIQHILGTTPPDADTLTWLQSQFATIPGVARSPARALEVDLEMAVQSLRTDPETLTLAREGLVAAVGAEEAWGLTDEEVLAMIRKPCDDFLSATLRLVDSDMPYEETYRQIKAMQLAVEDEVRDDPVTGMLLFWPQCVLKIHQVQVRHKAHLNAVKAALEIYRIAAETKQLPETLPSFLPKDPYSREDFEYETTEDGFILRCRGRDIDVGSLIPGCSWVDEGTDCIADKIHEYEFKVTW